MQIVQKNSIIKQLQNNNLVIIIDGLSGTMPHEVSQMVANELNYYALQVDVLQRLYAIKIMVSGMQKSPKQLRKILNNTVITCDQNHYFIDNVNVDDMVFSPGVTNLTEYLIGRPYFHRFVVEKTKPFLRNKRLVLSGNCVSEYFHDYDFAFFLVGDFDKRAWNWFNQYKKLKLPAELNFIKNQLQQFDTHDVLNEEAPLEVFPSMITINITNKSNQNVASEIIDYLIKILNKANLLVDEYY